MITKVTGKNQVTIPAALARELDIHPGSELEWSRGKEKGTLRIRLRPSTDTVLRGIQELLAPYHIDPQQALADLERMREEDDPEYGPDKGHAK